MRDDFPSKVRETLAKRAGFRCSKPDCDAATVGPQKSEDAGSVNLGRAAHITAASPGGPRYEPLLTAKERKSQANGIWLCANCADHVDKDEPGYPVELLKHWKREAEARAKERLGKARAAKGDPHRALERQIKHEHKVRDDLKRNMLAPFNSRVRGREAKCYRRFHGSKVVIHSLADRTYPNVISTALGVISPWFVVEPYDFYAGGLMVILNLSPGVLDSAGNWKLINPDRENVDLERFRRIQIWIIGKIPWRNIRHYDFEWDGHYYPPHLYCAFAEKGEPYEGVEYYLDGDDYDWPLDPAKEIRAPMGAPSRPRAPGGA